MKFIAAVLLFLSMAGCSGSPTAPVSSDPLAQAAAEATAIVQQAQATALVLQAQVQATRLIGQAGMALDTPKAPAAALATEVRVLAVQATPTGLEAPAATTPTGDEAASNTPVTETVELLSVGFAAEGGFIIVNFKAPPSITQTWWQGSIEVIEEASGTVFNEIPVMPVIGPLIGRPVEAGQIGYVMLTHNPPSLRPGALVTVRLGEYKFERVKIE